MSQADAKSVALPERSSEQSALDVARRLYLYAIAALSLGLLGAGLANLLELTFTRLAASRSDPRLLVGTTGDIRRQLSVYVAIILVTLPIWMLHWYLVERSRTRDAAERIATIRAVYLALALAIPFIFVIRSLHDLLYRVIVAVASSDISADGRLPVSEAVAFLVVGGAIFGYHLWTRVLDECAGPLPAHALWPTRIYLYAAAFTGVMLLLVGFVDLLDLVTEAAFTPDDGIIRGDRWWVRSLVAGLTNALLGCVVWGVHWWYSLRRVESTDWRGESERRSAIRRVYLYLAAFVGMALTLYTVVRILDAAFRSAFGVFPANESLGQRLTSSLLRLGPFCAVWIYHRRQVVTEAARFAEEPLQAGIRRVYTYGAALIGLAFAGFGVSRLIALSLNAFSSGAGRLTNTGDEWRREVSIAAAIALTGLGTWLWHWYSAQRAAANDPAIEREATTRRIYLFLTLGASVVAALAGLSVIVYRILSIILDVAGRGDFLSDISEPIGASTVAVAILVYHGLILRSDLSGRPDGVAPEQTLSLVLSGPHGADLAPLLDELRGALPEGYHLRQR